MDKLIRLLYGALYFSLGVWLFSSTGGIGGFGGYVGYKTFNPFDQSGLPKNQRYTAEALQQAQLVLAYILIGFIVGAAPTLTIKGAQYLYNEFKKCFAPTQPELQQTLMLEMGPFDDADENTALLPSPNNNSNKNFSLTLFNHIKENGVSYSLKAATGVTFLIGFAFAIYTVVLHNREILFKSQAGMDDRELQNIATDFLQAILTLGYSALTSMPAAIATLLHQFPPRQIWEKFKQTSNPTKIVIGFAVVFAVVGLIAGGYMAVENYSLVAQSRKMPKWVRHASETLQQTTSAIGIGGVGAVVGALTGTAFSAAMTVMSWLLGSLKAEYQTNMFNSASDSSPHRDQEGYLQLEDGEEESFSPRTIMH